ncbi:14125_t:CDS:2, partial [Racocetra fulgida]
SSQFLIKLVELIVGVFDNEELDKDRKAKEWILEYEVLECGNIIEQISFEEIEDILSC